MAKSAGATATEPVPPRTPPARRPVEESLGDALIRSIDAFVFRDIENEEAAIDVFSFVQDRDAQVTLGRSLLGARWQQKAGLALARGKSHPAHAAMLRSQVIEYGAIVELLLRELIREEQQTGLPASFHDLIERAATMGVLGETSVAAATRRREARNSVHLTVGSEPLTGSSTAKALADVKVIVNECRVRAGLDEWEPVRPGPRTPTTS